MNQLVDSLCATYNPSRVDNRSTKSENGANITNIEFDAGSQVKILFVYPSDQSKEKFDEVIIISYNGRDMAICPAKACVGSIYYQDFLSYGNIDQLFAAFPTDTTKRVVFHKFPQFV